MKMEKCLITEKGTAVTFADVQEAILECSKVFYGLYDPGLLCNHKETILAALQMLREKFAEE